MYLKDVLESKLLSAKRGFSSQKDELQTNLPLSPDHFSQSLKAKKTAILRPG